jgi:glycosyltransferase involved in cell wall biosynthesis
MREFNAPAELQTVRLLFMAGFVPSKGMDVVLESFRLLARKGSEVKFKLTMAGDGPELEKCKQIVSNKKIENVTFTGYVSGIEKHNYLESADILFLPSYTEGLPCVIMEAMLYGLAIVTRPIGGIPFWVKHNVNGWLSDSMDPEVFADGLLSLVAEPELLYAMRKTNHEIAVNNFTPDKMKIQLKHIYDSID